MSSHQPPGDKPPIDAYFRFLNISQTIRQEGALAGVDAVDQRLLEFVGASEHRGERLSVTGAMAFKAAGSPATVYRRLQRLRERGWIEVCPCQDDPRAKLVTLSASAHDYFAQLAAALRLADQNGAPD
ncbi:hypothetical protein [Rhodocyclus tenuis]|uniref:hypothetical protein n=1 Tax=Rhodocyclus tenuis TaxID=1066 RepID=UPI001906DF99|nr:hypothetical protein [Rhodocyclus tenuis]MBK1681625.1 hypothetical protein [Rhodocyclus tenuis]